MFNRRAQNFRESFIAKKSQLQEGGIIHKKNILLETSILFVSLLLLLLIFDIVYYISVKSASLTSQWLVSILILHIISSSFAVLSFIYANESSDYKTIRIAGISVILNASVMLSRALVEYSFQDYKPQQFSQ